MSYDYRERLLRLSSFAYCIQYLGYFKYILLNRKYKPLGVISTEFIDYDDPKHTFYTKRFTKSIVNKLITYRSDGTPSIHPSEDGTAFNRLYLYNDGCIPTDSKIKMAAYLEKLKVLMSMRVYPASEGEPEFVRVFKAKEKSKILKKELAEMRAKRKLEEMRVL